MESEREEIGLTDFSDLEQIFPMDAECLVFSSFTATLNSFARSPSTTYPGSLRVLSPMYCFLLLLFLRSLYAQRAYDVYMTMTPAGYEFQPENASVQLISTLYAPSSLQCAQACASSLGCQTFDYDSYGVHRCRLYQADQSTGKNIPSAPSSIVGSISITSQQFTSFNRTPCSTYCSGNPYLSCDANDTCQCAARTYWDGSICRPQKVTGPSCTTNSECRSDLGLVCLQFFQCGRKCHRSRQNVADHCIAV